MSVYCMYCGKVLTTGDRIDRCFPDCNVTIFSAIDDYKQTLQESLDRIIIERDQLKTENERLKVILGHLFEACMRADIEGDLSELISGDILDAAQQALNEVKK